MAMALAYVGLACDCDEPRFHGGLLPFFPPSLAADFGLGHWDMYIYGGWFTIDLLPLHVAYTLRG